MSTTVPPPKDQKPETLEDELHELEREEAALAARTSRLELSGPLALLLSILALALALGAMIVAFANSDSGSSTGDVPAATGGSSAGGASAAGASAGTAGGMNMSGGQTASGQMTSGMTMGSNGRVTFTPAQLKAASKGTVYVKLGEFWIMPTVSSVRAGKVTFVAQNVGMAVHELMIERMPIKMSGPGQPVEDAAQGMIDDMKTGGTGRMTMRLTPGTYELFCNVTGHYSSGQHIQFTVTK